MAGLFALHPLHVESVAWVAERKDLLSAFFWFAGIGAWALYVERPALTRYLAVAALFAAGLMSKPMLVTFPFVLLLLDWWPLGRFGPGFAASLWPLVREKLPLFALSALSSAVTFAVQRGAGAVTWLETWPLPARLANALVSCARYLGKTVWPAGLAPFYPRVPAWPAWAVAGAALLLAGVTALALREARRRPWFAVGWFWFLGTLVPVIGIVQVGMQAMADRYTYVPLVGIFIAVAWGAAGAGERITPPRAGGPGAARRLRGRDQRGRPASGRTT